MSLIQFFYHKFEHEAIQVIAGSTTNSSKSSETLKQSKAID